MFAHSGDDGRETVKGAYSARKGSQVIAASTPRLQSPSTSRSAKISVPVFVLTVGNQIAGLFMGGSESAKFLVRVIHGTALSG